MKCFLSYATLSPNTVNGHIIVVTQTYTTFDDDEAKELENRLVETIKKNGIMTEFDMRGEEDADKN